MMFDDEELSQLIWKRVGNQIPQKTRNSWKLKGLNDRWRFCRYNQGHYFGMHVDGGYRPNAEGKDEYSHLNSLSVFGSYPHVILE